MAARNYRTPPAERARLMTALFGDTPKLQLRKIEWAVWTALGDIVIQDAGPRYESAEFIAAHLYAAGAVICD